MKTVESLAAWIWHTGWRMAVLAALMIGACLLAVYWHLQLVLSPPEQLQKKMDGLSRQIAHQQSARLLRQAPIVRGNITDRKGKWLAVSVYTSTLAIDLALFRSDEAAWQQLAEIDGIHIDIEVEKARIQRLKEKGKTRVIFLQRKMNPATTARVRQLNIAGIVLEPELDRTWPAGEMMAPVIGLVDVDGRPQEGLEATYHKRLSTGADLQLTLDSTIQDIAYRALKKAIIVNGASAGSLMIVHIETGEILAMISYPSYNPNNRQHLKIERNRAAMDQIEPGSTFKPLTVATALATGDWQLDSTIDASKGYIRLSNGATCCSDLRPMGVLSLPEIIIRSSNVGAGTLATSLPPETLISTLQSLGFSQQTGAGFEPEAVGYLPIPRALPEIVHASLGFGYSCTVTMLQLVQAYGVLGNKGRLQPLKLVQGISGPEPKQIFSPEVTEQVLAVMEQAVRMGTGKHAQIRDYRVAGKTGTSHRVGKYGYLSNSYNALFAGLVPVSKPHLAIAVLIEEPDPNRYYGGQVSAPVFADVARQALIYLGVPPDAEVRG